MTSVYTIKGYLTETNTDCVVSFSSEESDSVIIKVGDLIVCVELNELEAVFNKLCGEE